MPEWVNHPRTVDEALKALEKVACYELMFNEPAPAESVVLLTNELMMDILRRITRLETEHA